MRIKITSDSTCDLTEELIAKHQIHIFPLGVTMGSKLYQDGVDIFPADIYRHVDGGGDICSTSAINTGEYLSVFQRYAAEYDAVIHINLGSGFSCCHQNACLAAEGLPNVFVVDSQNLSTGHGHVVLEAVERAEAGMAPEEICRELEELIPRVETSFVLDRLDYMHKGGRCSAVAALGANLLHLKPSIEVVNGKMQVSKKYRGSTEKCVLNYMRDRLEGRKDICEERVFITDSFLDDDIPDKAQALVKECLPFQQLIHTKAGCTISSHCGPNCIGVLFIRKE